MKRRTPLESLHAAKQRDKEASAARLLKSVRSRRGAEEIADHARAERMRDSEALRTLVVAEEARAESGVARAGDLAFGEQHRRGAEERLRARAEEERVAEERARALRVAEEAAMDALSRARGAERAVAIHRARLDDGASKDAERRDEEEAHDVWTAARSGLGRKRPP